MTAKYRVAPVTVLRLVEFLLDEMNVVLGRIDVYLSVLGLELLDRLEEQFESAQAIAA